MQKDYDTKITQILGLLRQIDSKESTQYPVSPPSYDEAEAFANTWPEMVAVRFEAIEERLTHIEANLSRRSSGGFDFAGLVQLAAIPWDPRDQKIADPIEKSE